MKISPRQIGFDIDCVVADTMESFIRLAAEDYDIKIYPGEITDFMVEECLDIDPYIIDSIFARLMLDPISCKLQPMADAVAVLSAFAQSGPLTFITARPDAGPISEWLAYHLGREILAESRLVATGNHDGKMDHIRRIGLTHFVDDRASTCNLLAKERDITAIVYNQPWNLGKHALSSVDDWHGIKELCLSD